MNEDKLIQIEQALYALADELAAKYPRHLQMGDIHTYWEEQKALRHRLIDYFDQAADLLIQAYDLGGLSLRIRNYISTYIAPLRKRHSTYGYFFWWFAHKLIWNPTGVIAYDVAILRCYAAQVRSKPVDKVALYEQRRQRRERYRLPPETRTGGREDEPYEYRSWEEALKAPERVQRLLLRGNGNPPINSEIARFRNLRFLLGYANGGLPEEIGDLTELRQLSLPYFASYTLPDSLARLDKLAILYMGSTHFKTLPEAITRLPNLSALTLSRVETLPARIGNLRRLRLLEVTGLEQLPDEIGEMESLETLALEYNDLHDLPESLTRLTHLSYLNLGSNKFQHFPADLLAELPNLEVLVWGSYRRTPLPSPGDLLRLKNLRRVVFKASYPREELERLHALRPELIVRTW